MSLLGTSFTVFDVETTGLDAQSGDRIVEIAAVRIDGGIIDDTNPFFSLVNPNREISWEAQRVNKITNEEIATAPAIELILPKFLEFAGDSILIAHNAMFDMSFLEAEKEMCWGYIDIPECLCTMRLSRAIFPHEFRHNLDIVGKRLGIAAHENRHRALPDVLLTAQVFLSLLQKGKIASMEELRRKAGIQVAA